MEPDLIEDDLSTDFEGLNDIEFDFEHDEDDDDDFDLIADDDDDDDIYDDLAADGWDDDDIERRRRRRRRRRRHRVHTGKGRNYFQTQLKGYARKSELKRALSRVGRDVRKNAKAIRGNASRIASNRSRISSVARINSRQSKEIAKLRAEQAQQQQMQMLMSLLQGNDREFTDYQEVKDANGRTTSIKVTEKRDSFAVLLPLLLGGMGGSGKGGGMGLDNPAMMLVLAEAMKD